MTHRIRRLSTAAVCALAAVPAHTAVAQGSGQQQADTVMEELIVTARKREESIQDVPLTVSAFTADTIAARGIENIEDIARLTPGFTWETAFGRQFDRPVIRGQANILGTSGVSTFIDGVNVTQSIRALNFGDVDRIEVIKGPQSALFGRNTYAGAINIITRQPTNEFEGQVKLDYGEDDKFEFLSNVRGPIIEDTLFYSVSFRYYDFDSEFTSAADGRQIGQEESISASGSFRFLPTEWLDTTLRLAYNKDDDGHFPTAFLGFDELNVNNPDNPSSVFLGGPQRFFQGVVPPEAPAPSGSNQLVAIDGIEREEFFLSLNTTIELGAGYTLSTVTGYTTEHFRDELDSDAEPPALQPALFFGPTALGPGVFGGGVGIFDFTTTDDDRLRTIVQEFRVDSPQDRRFRWRLGFYFFDERDDNQDLFEHVDNQALQDQAEANVAAAVAALGAELGGFFVNFIEAPFLSPSDRNIFTTTNYAAFGSVYFDLTDQLTVSAELRYAVDKLGFEVRDPLTNDLLTFDTDDGEILADLNEDFDSITPRFTVDWQATDDNLIYAVAARGTKPGGFNDSDGIESGFTTFDEETLWTFELGTKNTFFGGQLVANVAGFFSLLDGYQLTNALSAITGGDTTTSVIVNVGEAEIFGLELELLAAPAAIPGLSFGGNYAFTDAEFTDGTESTQELVFGDASIAGQRIPRQARHMASFFIDYTMPINDSWDVFSSLGGTYESSRFAQVQNLAETGDSFELDARIGITNGTFRLSFYGENINNEDAVLSVLRFVDANAMQGPGGTLVFGPEELFPRGFQASQRPGARWGIEASVSF